MALEEYKKKRSFNKTPEPEGKVKKAGEELIFVVQKHAASHLHYDFRLELKGVLKSWAVPKGPSLNPDDKRLAMHVEDHPFDYKDFEGIIPKGNYGAGSVILWDEGTYTPAEPVKGIAAMEKQLTKEFFAGSMRIVLKGKKLKGEFALVKSKNRDDNSWLLIKKHDKYSGDMDITLKDKSVVSKKTIEQMTTSKNAETWISNRKSNGELNEESGRVPAKKGAALRELAAEVKGTGKTASSKTSTTATNPDADAGVASSKKGSASARKAPAENSAAAKNLSRVDAALAVKEVLKPYKALPATPMPTDLKPMLATLVDKPFDSADWIYEVKWDGYRALAYIDKKYIELRSRNNNSFNEKFYPVYEAIKNWPIRAVVDGEIVVLNEKGITKFSDLQGWRSEADGDLIFYLFDVLWLEGKDLTELTVVERREVLKAIVPEEGLIRISENFEASATEFLQVAQQMGLEGIIAKKADSTYHIDSRSKEWLKIKTEQRHEAIITGYTRNEDTTKDFSALLLGVYEGKELKFIGQVGTGFTDKVRKELLATMNELKSKECPYPEVPVVNKPSRFRPNPPKAEVVWLKPELVCEVRYQELTSEGVMRHAAYQGLREDKKANEVTREEAKEVETVVNDSASGVITPVKASGRKTLLNPKDESQTRNIDGHDLKFTNLSKIYWPDEKITKRDMLNYYYQIAPFMLPYMKDRPQSLNRHPNGIKGESFYQKNVSGKVEPWITTHDYENTSKEGNKTFLVCTDEASLMYIAKLGCIEMNPWHSRIAAPDNPDWCVVDLDPDTNSFEQVIEAAIVVRKILDAIKVPSFPKTSGSTGIHIYIPLGGKYDYEQSKQLAELIVTIAHQELSGFTSLERNPAKRKAKIYLDFLQNRAIQTIAAPYSLRPKPGATASTPLHWDEVKKGLKMQDFNSTLR